MIYSSNYIKSVISDLIRELYNFCAMGDSSLKKSCNFFFLLLILIFLSTNISRSQNSETFKIGFLIRDKNDQAIRKAAVLAIQHANENGGYKGQNFELVIRSCDGPWGQTSKQAVALIYEDQVPIVVTALDGRNAHLAEQVTAKAHVAMLSTLSSDPTLSRAYVPWYFRIVPDDKQQAKLLVDEIYVRRKAQRVAMIVLDGYDGKKSAEAFEAEVNRRDYPQPSVLNIENDNSLELIKDNIWEAVVLAGTPKDENKLIRLSKDLHTYAFFNYFNFSNSRVQVHSIQTIGFTSLHGQAQWQAVKSISAFHPHISTQSLAFVYDGISLAVESIKKYGPDSEAIRKGFKDLQYKGLTGKIEFDKFGNRKEN